MLYRTIMALWKAISLSIELKVQLAEEQSQINTLQSEDSGVFVGIEDAKSLQMTEVFSSTISTNVSSGDLYGKSKYTLAVLHLCKFINYLYCGPS